MIISDRIARIESWLNNNTYDYLITAVIRRHLDDELLVDIVEYSPSLSNADQYTLTVDKEGNIYNSNGEILKEEE